MMFQTLNFNEVNMHIHAYSRFYYNFLLRVSREYYYSELLLIGISWFDLVRTYQLNAVIWSNYLYCISCNSHAFSTLYQWYFSLNYTFGLELSCCQDIEWEDTVGSRILIFPLDSDSVTELPTQQTRQNKKAKMLQKTITQTVHFYTCKC